MKLAPDEIPTASPSSRASFCAIRIASPSQTSTTGSSASSRTIAGMNSSEIPWIRCWPTLWPVRSVGELAGLILDVGPGRRIGYVTDLRYTDANLHALDALLAGVDLLFIEAVFLDAEADHAERKNHLTAAQAGRIARRLGARAVVPFHFSPRYEGRAQEVRAEVLAACQDSGR